MDNEFPGHLQNLIQNKSLKWIFVGGKGGVGKTTTSSSIATMLAQQNKEVLIISTDPAHNLSDCFDQKILSEPTQIQGIPHLHAMEIDSKIDQKSLNIPNFQGQQVDEGTNTFIAELLSSVPGIDEAMGFAQLVKTIESLQFDTIVFDTAPTGHTLKLLNFPNILEKGLEKLMQIKNKVGGLLGGLLGGEGQENSIENMFNQLEVQKLTVEKVNLQMKDPARTTFVAVCIPEFLSLYETERLVLELANYEIDIHNIVVNQVLFPEDACKMCNSRSKMQKKYLDQIIELYEDMHVVIQPLQNEEVRGVEKLKQFSQLLLQQKNVPVMQNN